MERNEAELLVRSLLGRLKPVDTWFELPGGALSAQDMMALKSLAGVKDGADVEEIPGPGGKPSIPAVGLALDCLTGGADDGAVLCIDFGTAYSKAAIWREGVSIPVPLDLSKGADPTTTSLLVDSAAYIGEGRIFFGPKAV